MRECLCEQRLIAQHLCGLEQKPRGLYVVTVGDVGVDTVPVIIEKETEMMRAAVFHDVKEYMHQVHDIGAQAFVGPHTVEIGIWLNDVQVGVHRLGAVGVFVAQTHVVDRTPVAGHGLDISPLGRITAAGLDATVKVDCLVKCLAVAGGPDILAKAVDHETDGVELFLCVKRHPVGCQAPIHPAVLTVDEMRHDIVEHPVGGLEIFLAAGSAVCRRECPQQAAVEYGAFRSVIIEAVATVAATVEPAATVMHTVNPVRQYIAGKVIDDLFFQ